MYLHIDDRELFRDVVVTVYKCIEENNTQQILPIIKYINDNYTSAIFDEYNSEKSHIPTWRIGDKYSRHRM